MNGPHARKLNFLTILKTLNLSTSIIKVRDEILTLQSGPYFNLVCIYYLKVGKGKSRQSDPIFPTAKVILIQPFEKCQFGIDR